MKLWSNRDDMESVRHYEFYEKNWKKNFYSFLQMIGLKIC